MSTFQIIGNLVIAGVGAVLTMWGLWFLLLKDRVPFGTFDSPHKPIRYAAKPVIWMDEGLTPVWDWPAR